MATTRKIDVSVLAKIDPTYNEVDTELGVDYTFLYEALEKVKTDNVLDLTWEKIMQQKADVLDELALPRNQNTKMLEQLQDYRFVDEHTDVEPGSYIRWIPLKDPAHVKLTNGGIVCGAKTVGPDGILHILCRNKMGRIFQVNLSSTLVFKKLTDEEQTILAAIDALALNE